MSDAAVAAELDLRHADASRAFAARDMAAYRALFRPDLIYRRRDGGVIGLDELMRDVARQFRNLSHASSSFAREQLTICGDAATETLDQTATAGASAFGFVRRSWDIRRRGDYTWTREDGVWRIRRVEVHAETMSAKGWRLAWR